MKDKKPIEYIAIEVGNLFGHDVFLCIPDSGNSEKTVHLYDGDYPACGPKNVGMFASYVRSMIGEVESHYPSIREDRKITPIIRHPIGEWLGREIFVRIDHEGEKTIMMREEDRNVFHYITVSEFLGIIMDQLETMRG